MERTAAENKVWEEARRYCHAAASTLQTYKQVEHTIATAMGVSKDSGEVMKLLRLSNWFVGCNQHSRRKLKRIARDVVRQNKVGFKKTK